MLMYIYISWRESQNPSVYPIKQSTNRTVTLQHINKMNRHAHAHTGVSISNMYGFTQIFTIRYYSKAIPHVQYALMCM